MRHRDLIIRVYEPFPDVGYVRLAQQIGSHLVAERLDAVLVTDGTITAAEVARSVRETSGADGQGVGQAAGVRERAADADD